MIGPTLCSLIVVEFVLALILDLIFMMIISSYATEALVADKPAQVQLSEEGLQRQEPFSNIKKIDVNHEP